MSNMNKHSLNDKGEHSSPLSNDRIDRGYDNLDVRLLYWPDKERFDLMVHKATLATRGGDIYSNEVDPKIVEDAFSGGLNQCLEWVTVVFEISGVSRGLTHELVRTRQGSFAQQSMRHTYMGSDPNMRMPEYISGDTEEMEIWEQAIQTAREAYEVLCRWDVPYQDARTVLPIATETYIIASYPLKVFLDTFAYRACSMFYPEIVELFEKMRRVLLEECPWLGPFTKISCEKTRPNGEYLHMCTYQGWERVEGHCPLSWAKESNRVWKSKRFDS